MNAVYLDYNATTPLHSEVLQAMLPYWQGVAGNPTSRHSFGRMAREAVEYARMQVAQAVGAESEQVIFTASGTEANNLAIRGMTEVDRQDDSKRQVLVSAIEHPCVLNPALNLSREGVVVQKLLVDAQGQVEMDTLLAALRVPTTLVSIMLANNETGVVQAIPALAEQAHRYGALFHTDAVQAVGKIPVQFTDLGVDAMTIASHKIQGPHGVGALIVKKKVDIRPLLLGGGQEKGLRSGTENVPAIVGFGMACERAVREMQMYQQHTSALRDYLEQGLRSMGALIFSAQSMRLPNTSFFSFDNLDGETLVIALDRAGFAVASGSACSSNSHEPSHVLRAMGVTDDVARGAVRVSLSLASTQLDIDAFLGALAQVLARLRPDQVMVA